MIDPGTATLLTGGLSTLGGGVSAASGKGAAKSAAKAAEKQAAAVQEASKYAINASPLIDFGLQTAGNRYDTMFGNPAKRFDMAREAELEGAFRFTPSAQAARRQEMLQNMFERGNIAASRFV